MARHTTDEYGRRVAKALQLLAEGMDADKVALKVGVRQKTIRAWIDDTEFGIVHDCLRAFGRMKFSRESLDRLKPEAMETLRRLLKDGSGTAAAQAARDVLKWVREFEKEQQAAAKEQEKHHRGDVLYAGREAGVNCAVGGSESGDAEAVGGLGGRGGRGAVSKARLA